MNHLDAGQDGSGAGERLEAEHGSDSSFDAPVILLDAVVQVLALPDTDRLQRSSCSIPKPVLTIAGNDCLAVGLAAVYDDAIGP